ncbi:TPA: glutamate-5-semialdehyde dehydrogenase [Candidatus Avacholeplasma faecigallinarum]|nr:glutamate-5-semialdehyde dehydrogenase [Candidatus Avacholeplasma faecigallinarum]
MLDELLSKVKKASFELLSLDNKIRKECLINMANTILNNQDEILKKNQEDILNAKTNNLSQAMIERLTLNENRIKSLANSIIEVANLNDVVGKNLQTFKRPNGLIIEKIAVPFGVIAAIFESRPNVCVDIASLCLKTANACVLKGGKEAINTNKELVRCMKEAIGQFVDPNCITLIEDINRSTTIELLQKRQYIDLLIPRGGKGLIEYVVNNAKVPYIETGSGNCHLYVNEYADINMALNIAINAKYQRPSVCNSIENIIVDEKIAPLFLPKLYEKFKELNIEMRGCSKTLEIIKVNPATLKDFYTEYNDYIIAIKIVKDIYEAISHINIHSSKHSEAIITNDLKMRDLFLNSIDSACVYHNASTRFTDGGEFGFGQEVGISTQKLHARGPMGINEICTYKYKIYGNGEVRK